MAAPWWRGPLVAMLGAIGGAVSFGGAVLARNAKMAAPAAAAGARFVVV